jgi:hypothetical protein
MNPKNRMKRRMLAFAGRATGHSARPLMGLLLPSPASPQAVAKTRAYGQNRGYFALHGGAFKADYQQNPRLRAGGISWRARINQRLNR